MEISPLGIGVVALEVGIKATEEFVDAVVPEEFKPEEKKGSSTKFVLMSSTEKSEFPSKKSDSEALAKTRAELATISTSEPAPILSAPVTSNAPSA